MTGLAGWAAGIAAVIVAGSAQAGTSVIANGAAEVFAGAGWSDGSVDTIRFTVPGGNVGDGSAITGFENGTRTDTLIDASARAPVLHYVRRNHPSPSYA